MSGLTWLDEWSASAVMQVLATSITGLADGDIVLRGGVDETNPEWSAGSAVVDGRYLAKFALSEPTASRLWHEARVLGALSGSGLRIPEMVAACDRPVHLVTRMAAGGPLSYELVSAATAAQVRQIGEHLGGFLAALHQPAVLSRVESALGAVDVPDPGPQATTGELRDRLGPWVRAIQRGLVRSWCDWADQVLAADEPGVFVHGDLHGHNQLWDQRRRQLRAVVDWETSGVAEPEYDLRYVPALGPGTGLLIATADAYRDRASRPVRLDRVMAWHVRTALGDALWRSEAGIPLPGGGTPAGYVDELAGRFDDLKLGP